MQKLPVGNFRPLKYAAVKQRNSRTLGNDKSYAVAIDLSTAKTTSVVICIANETNYIMYPSFTEPLTQMSVVASHSVQEALSKAFQNRHKTRVFLVIK